MDEPWKEGSEEKREPQEFLAIPLGRPGAPLTPEERQRDREKFEDQIKKEISLGDLAYPSLPVFDIVRGCKKCGHSVARVIYHSRGGAGECLPHTGNREHMHRICDRCGYQWFERVLEEDPQ